MENFKLDDRVKVIGKNGKGRIAFIGKTHLSDGIMYGIALDKPKGRGCGNIGDVQYFMCPKDHGVFVRACQLEMDSGNSSEGSEENNRDVMPRPIYPNYLKYSSKMNFRKSKYHSEHVSKVKPVLKQDVCKKQSLENNISIENSYPVKVISDPLYKVKKQKQLLKKREEKRASIDEKFRFLTEKINTQTQQIDITRRCLKKLKTYVRWSRGFDSKGNQMKKFLETAIESVIRNMEEVIGKSEINNNPESEKGDIGMEKENNLLLQYIWDLEKKNETLVECLTKIRALLLNSRKSRTKSKLKNDAKRKEASERHRPCCCEHNCKTSPKKPETQPTSDMMSKTQQHLDENFQKDNQVGETETVKRYLESLNFGDKNKNQDASFSSLPPKKENGLGENTKGDKQELPKAVCVKNYLESINHDIKELNKELTGEKSAEKCGEKVNSKPASPSENTKSPILQENIKLDSPDKTLSRPSKVNTKAKYKMKREKIDIRPQPYALDKKPKPEKNYSNDNTDYTEDEKDPTKELFELISNIMTNINSREQTEMKTKDSLEFKEHNINRSATSVIASKCFSSPDSDKFEKVSNSSIKSKSEGNLKSSKSVPGSTPRKKKLPKKRTPLK